MSILWGSLGGDSMWGREDPDPDAKWIDGQTREACLESTRCSLKSPLHESGCSSPVWSYTDASAGAAPPTEALKNDSIDLICSDKNHYQQRREFMLPRFVCE